MWAVCTGGVDNGPNGREYWEEVVSLHWRKADGSKGKEISKAMYESIEEYDEWWQACVTEQVSDYLAYEQDQESGSPPEMVTLD